MASHLLVSMGELHKHRGWFLALGIGLIVLGIIALGYDVVTTALSVVLFGWLLVLGGILEIIHAFSTHRWGGFFLNFIAGLLTAVAGVLFVSHPLVGALTLTLFLGAFFLVGGVVAIVSAVRLQHPHWGWGVLGGVVTGLLGLLLWAQWPFSGLWFIGFAIGLQMIFRGWAWVMLALASRSA